MKSELDLLSVKRRTLLKSAVLLTLSSTDLAAKNFETTVQLSSFEPNFRGGDRELIQAAIDTLFSRGEPITLLFDKPREYILDGPILCKPGVSLVASSKDVKLISKGGRKRLQGAIFLAGNFHPDFTEDITYSPCVAADVHDSFVELETNDEAARFRVGDQLLVASKKNGVADRFKVPLYAWLNSIEKIDGRRLVLREKIDVSTELGVAPLREYAARNDIPLFFHSDAVIRGFTIVTPGHWIGDSACLNVKFIDNDVKSSTGVWGNSFQNCVWENNVFRVSHKFYEQSHNSIHNIVKNNIFLRDASADVNADFYGFSFQEYSRGNEISNCFADFGDCFGKRSPLIWVLNANHVTFSGNTVIAGYCGGASIVAIGHRSVGYDFPICNNVVSHNVVSVGVCGRFVDLDGFGSKFFFGNKIDNNFIRGRASEGETIRIRRTVVENKIDGRFESVK